MARLLRSFFYKLFRDTTFRVVFFVGIGLSIVFSSIYCFLVGNVMGSGAYCFISSVSPSQNFGIAVPINLSIFLSLLFNQGIIRNQVIVGNSKVKVYFSLLIGGIVFVLGLMTVYIGLTTLLATLFKGFYNGFMTESLLPSSAVGKIVLVTILNYILITVYTVFIGTIFKNSGTIISFVLVPVLVLSIVSMVITLIGVNPNGVPQIVSDLNRFLNPQYAIGRLTGLISSLANHAKLDVTNEDLIIGLVNNLVYIGIFTVGGVLLFKKRDLK